MFQQIKNTWLFSKNRFWGTIVCVFGTAVFSVLLVMFIVKVLCKDDPEITGIQLASLMAYIVLWIAMPIWGMTDFGKSFDMMVGMGRTRKEFFSSYCIANFASNLVYVAVIVLITVLDKALYGLLYQGIPCEMDLSAFFLDIRTIGATVLMSFGLNILLGALYLKFRAKIFMFVWIICMCLGIFMKLIAQAIEAEVGFVMAIVEGIVSFFTAGAVVVLAVLVVVTFIITVISYAMVRKQEIVSW